MLKKSLAPMSRRAGMNRRALQQKYAAIRGFIATDCEPQTGVDKLRAAIEREVDTGRCLWTRPWAGERQAITQTALGSQTRPNHVI